MIIQSQNLDFSYGGRDKIIRSLDIVPRQFGVCALLGQSGIGKSTLLKVIAGALRPTSGRISISSKDGISPAIGYVSQSDSLLPWLSIEGNVDLCRQLTQCPPDSAKAEAKSHLLSEFGLAKSLAYLPHQLSGGMKKRAALASALLSGANLLLLDEPFVGSDAKYREAMYSAVRSVCEHGEKSAIFTTHDAVDVIELADTVLWLRQTDITEYVVIDALAGWSREAKDQLSALIMGGG